VPYGAARGPDPRTAGRAGRFARDVAEQRGQADAACPRLRLKLDADVMLQADRNGRIHLRLQHTKVYYIGVCVGYRKCVALGSSQLV